MSWNGTGTYTRTNGTNTGSTLWADDAAAAVKITTSRHDTHDEDIAQAINACLTQNNESKPTADFVPNADDTYDLGSASAQWAEGFFSKSVHWNKGADVASATALPLISDGNMVDVTGTTTITSFNSVGVGTLMILQFDGALTLTHNATDLILPGAANITTAAGDEGIFYEYASGDWRCVHYTRNEPVVSNHVRVGNTQFADGSNQGRSNFAVSSEVTTATTESVGPTGSGADNIWAALDEMPSRAVGVVLGAQLSLTSISGTGIANVYATHGDVTLDADINDGACILRQSSAASGVDAPYDSVIIPVNASQVFNIHWTQQNCTLATTLYYRGFITD